MKQEKKHTYQRKYHFIYITTRFDGMFYVGMHSTDDLNDGYMGSGVRIWNSIKYHGKNKHALEIVEFYPSREALIEAERHLVDSDLLNDQMCMNLSLGGCGTTHNGSTAERIRKALTGKKLTTEHCANIKKALQETDKDLGAHWRGKKFSEEHKTNIGRGGAGRKDSDEARANKSKGKTGVKQSETHRLNNQKAQSKSYLIEQEDGTQQSITNLNQWCRENKIDQPSLRMESSLDKFYYGYKLRKPNGKLITTKREPKVLKPRDTRCTVDGITIYPTQMALVAELGQGKNGRRSPSFRFLTTEK